MLIISTNTDKGYRCVNNCTKQELHTPPADRETDTAG